MPESAIGFGGADWLAFSFAALLILLAFFRAPAWQNRLQSLAARTRRVMALLFFLPIVLRLLLLPNHPVPKPDLYDEFSHLLVADTLLHFRLANPPHPLHQFFETFFVLQQPAYSSIYSLGQGMALAFGRIISGIPWTGVLTTTGAFCALCYWMLRAYVEPGWALAGVALAVMEFGPLNLWMNCYWGGSLLAAAGCLVFGSLPRLRDQLKAGSSSRARDAILLGAGFGISLLTRPFESTILFASILLFFLPMERRGPRLRSWLKTWAVASLTAAPALVLILLQNKQVTGKWTMLPEQLSQYQYGVPTTLTIQPPAVPHVSLTPQQALEYKAQALMHGPDSDTPRRFLLRLGYRVREYRFFFLPPLYLALIAFMFTVRRKDNLWVAATLVLFALGTNLFPYLLVHYLAAVTCLFVLVAVAGLKEIARWRIRKVAVGAEIARVLMLLCTAQFVLWYGLHLAERLHFTSGLLEYETWDVINHGNPERRIAVAREIASFPGKLLVFVHYTPRHIFQNEWVWNAADIDASRVVWARDLGESEDEMLIRYYPDRRVVWFEPDAEPPTLGLREAR